MPRRPKLTQRLAVLILCGVFTVMGLALLVANGVTYFRYRQAWERVRSLSTDELRGIAETCVEIGKQSYQHLAGDELPPQLQKFKLQSAFLGPGLSELYLFDVAGLHVALRVLSSSRNQEVSVVSSLFGPKFRRIVWTKDPEGSARLNPTGRILTVSRGHMRGARDWIVLTEKICIIERFYQTGSDDELLTTIPLSETARAKIVAAMAALPDSVQGRKFDSGVDDGISLQVGFEADGESGKRDIGLANTWREEIGPLLESISEALPAEHRINFKQEITGNPIFGRLLQTSHTWAEEARLIGGFRPAWWCIWPRFVREPRRDN